MSTPWTRADGLGTAPALRNWIKQEAPPAVRSRPDRRLADGADQADPRGQRGRLRGAADPRSGEGWLYLAAVQDAYSRAIVGWSMATHVRATLVVDALQMALARRRPGRG